MIRNTRFQQISEALRTVPTIFGEQRTSQRYTYVGQSFPYGINTNDIATTIANSGSVTASDSLMLVGTGTTTASTALARTKQAVRYVPGHEGTALFTARFTAGVAGTTQQIGAVGADSGFGIGYNGASFGVFRRRAGVDTWTPETSWNVYTDLPDDGNLRSDGLPVLDPTKLNIYGLTYAYLGIAPITFYWYAGYQYGWVPLHVIDLTNAQAGTHIDVPVLPISLYVANGATTSNIVLATSSFNGSVMSTDNVSDDRTAAVEGSQASLVANAWQNVVTIKSASVFNGKSNYINTLIDYIGTANEGTRPVEWALFSNATFSTTLTYASVDAVVSALAYSTTAATVTNGRKQFGLSLAKSASDNKFMQDLSLNVYPGETMTLAARSAATSEVIASMNVREQF